MSISLYHSRSSKRTELNNDQVPPVLDFVLLLLNFEQGVKILDFFVVYDIWGQLPRLLSLIDNASYLC